MANNYNKKTQRTPTESEKKTLRDARVPPMEPIDDLDMALVEADETLRTEGEVKAGEMLEVGKNYIVFTPAVTLVGKLAALTAWELKLDEAAWVADTGRYHQAFSQGFSQDINSEVEPTGTFAVISRAAVVYCVPYKHPLPKAAI